MSRLVLAIDTATPAVTAGVVRRADDAVSVLAERVTVDPRAHAERLTPNVLAAVGDAGITMDHLTVVLHIMESRNILLIIISLTSQYTNL